MGYLCFGRSFQTKEPGGNPLQNVLHNIAKTLTFTYPIVNRLLLEAWIWLKPRGLNRFLERFALEKIKTYSKPLEAILIERVLTTEVRSTLSSAEEILWRVQAFFMSIFESILNENLRTAPVCPSEMNRVVFSGGLVVDGKFIPEGTNISKSGWTISYNEEYFPGPLVFRSERWVVDNDKVICEKDVGKATSAFNLFSIGAGYCAGQELNILEISILAPKYKNHKASTRLSHIQNALQLICILLILSISNAEQ
ncbi:hypothetical protein EYC80_006064 [Monilinia laxa]|uniref:Cytochrome P450 n=1 Tax=Monilinia laxa TaxID=61186 RepID=A0A5N6KG08_MONLA|nr:hypothetical protein EYC80_006064 [Monilinia laxa]